MNRLTTNVFRNHFVLEYEIPKWDGDLMQHNTYMPLAVQNHGPQSPNFFSSTSGRSDRRTGSMN